MHLEILHEATHRLTEQQENLASPVLGFAAKARLKRALREQAFGHP